MYGPYRGLGAGSVTPLPLPRRKASSSANPTANPCARNVFWTASASSPPKPKSPLVAVHDLGHLAATFPITAGVPLTTVSKTLRHSTLSTTANIYDHFTRQAARDAVDTIADILAQADRDATHKRWFRRLRPQCDHKPTDRQKGRPRQKRKRPTTCYLVHPG